MRGFLFIPAALLALAIIGFSGVATAQAPGPMSRGHKSLSSFPVDCNKCHTAGFGVPDDKCLSCHTHQPLRARIRAKKGFHAISEVTRQKCKDCHAEHKESSPGSGKGRRTTIDWKPFGGQRNFNHRLTGWPLEGTHRFQKCEKCHAKKYKTTKLPTYLGLREECTTCHFGGKKDHGVGGENPHKFTDVTLTDCTVCHKFENFRVTNLGSTRFDHDKTKFPLKGKHLKNKCVQCHKDDIAKFDVKEKFDDCKGCHEDSHKSVISAERRCDSCHSQKTNFRKTKFNHGKETRFALFGQHAKNRCKDCHKIGSKPEKPKMACVSCHEDVHKGRFGDEKCEGCHKSQGWKQMRFDHNKKTKFDLTGQHKTTNCTNCHRFGIATKFERFKSTDCASCHEHQRAHCGQFGLEKCERCHVQGGDRTSKFDHNATRFPLQRAHSKINCERCHKAKKLGESAECKKAVKYTGLEPQCFACHVDIHKEELGKDCTKCHTGGANFKTLVFDHNKDSQFSLTGFHQIVGCDDCHPKRNYKLGEIGCYSCHGKDDIHAEALGQDCAKCHETTGGAPKFDHNVHTDFLQEGAHARIECERCHFLSEDQPPAEIAAALDPATPDAGATDSGTTDAGAEGQVTRPATNSNAPKPAVAPPGAPLDLQFRVVGAECEACHPDPHQVRANLDCGSCHGFDDWIAPPKNGYHEGAGFSLTGAHTVVACNLCHNNSGSMAGRGERCGSCHMQDDIHAQSFGADCGRCHEQNGWVPTTFTHVDTGYVLEGLHRTLECRQCHQAGNYFIGNNCYNCHLTDYRGSTWHDGDDKNQAIVEGDFFIIGSIKNAGLNPDRNSFDCGECHTQFTWWGALEAIPGSE